MSEDEMAQKLFISRTALAPMDKDPNSNKWREFEADQALTDAAMFCAKQKARNAANMKNELKDMQENARGPKAKSSART